MACHPVGMAAIVRHSAIVGVITNNPVTPTDVVGDNTNNGENDNTNNGENGNINNGEYYGALHLQILRCAAPHRQGAERRNTCSAPR